MNRAPYKRYTEGSRLFYDVLSSSGKFYYTIEMLGEVAISCECKGNADFHKHCKHMTGAERKEREFQQNSRKSVEIPNHEVVKEKRELAPLNGDRAFSLLRK